MNIDNLHKKLLSYVNAKIIPFGYKRNKSNFYHREDGNWGVINFQRSTKSNKNIIIFTINLGVASSRLLSFFAINPSKSGPNFEDCHWQKRMGHLVQGKDVWWSIIQNTQIEILGEEIWLHLLNLGIPEIAKFIHDQNLRDLWLSGTSPSLTEFQRYLNLSILLKEIGPIELLEPIFEKRA